MSRPSFAHALEMLIDEYSDYPKEEIIAELDLKVEALREEFDNDKPEIDEDDEDDNYGTI